MLLLKMAAEGGEREEGGGRNSLPSNLTPDQNSMYGYRPRTRYGRELIVRWILLKFHKRTSPTELWF